MVKLILSCFAVLAAQAAAANSVSQVHLALTNRALDCAHGVSINFASDSADPFTVSFGTNDSQQTTVKTTSTSYKVKTYSSPYLHSANFCNLVPSTKYAYKVGDFQETFVSPPALSEEPTVIGLVGDADLEAGSFNQLLTPVQDKKTQAIVIVGDYSYANGNHKKWDQWYDLQQPIFSKIPTAGINGNHEVIQSSTGWDPEDYLGYLSRAATPITEENAKQFRTYYSVNFGVVHLVFIDDYVGSRFTVGSNEWLAERTAQFEWLQKDLAAVNREQTPYVVVVKHNPYYNTYQDHRCQCSDKIFTIEDPEACWKGIYKYGKPKSEPQCGLQAKFEDVYAKNKVDVVFSGHVHGYERSDYVYQNKVNKEIGSIYITTGAGGRGHAGDDIVNATLPSWNLNKNPKDFGASRIIATRKKMQVLWYKNDDMSKPADAVDVYPRTRPQC